jgi:hypothetical protein
MPKVPSFDSRINVFVAEFMCVRFRCISPEGISHLIPICGSASNFRFSFSYIVLSLAFRHTVFCIVSWFAFVVVLRILNFRQLVSSITRRPSCVISSYLNHVGLLEYWKCGPFSFLVRLADSIISVSVIVRPVLVRQTL